MYMSEEALNCPFYLMCVPEDSHTLGECWVSVLTKSDAPHGAWAPLYILYMYIYNCLIQSKHNSNIIVSLFVNESLCKIAVLCEIKGHCRSHDSDTHHTNVTYFIYLYYIHLIMLRYYHRSFLLETCQLTSAIVNKKQMLCLNDLFKRTYIDQAETVFSYTINCVSR